MKIRIIILILVIPLRMHAMEPQQPGSSAPPNALAQEIAANISVPGSQAPRREPVSKKTKNRYVAALDNPFAFQIASRQDPYEQWLSSAELLARAEIPVLHESSDGLVVEIPHFQLSCNLRNPLAPASFILSDPKLLLSDLRRLVAHVNDAGEGHPERIAFSGVPQLLLIKEKFRCNLTDAMCLWPTTHKAYMLAARLNMLKQFLDFTDEQFNKYIADEESKLAQLKRKKLAAARKYIDFARERFAYLKSIERGEFKQYSQSHPTPTYKIRPVNQYCIWRIKKGDDCEYLHSCPYLVRNQK